MCVVGSRMKLPSLRISHRIGLIAAAGVVGMLAVTGMFVYERYALNALEQTEAEARAMEALADQLQRNFIHLQGLEKDFFLNKKEEVLKEHKRKVDELRGEIKEIEAVIATHEGRNFPQPGRLMDVFKDYEAAFALAANTYKRLGLSPDQGLQRGLRTAGGYLAAMVGMEPRWLAAHGFSHRQLAGLIPVSAQVTTHFKVKQLRGDTGPEYRVVVDEYAPLHHASRDLPPICLIVGDRRIEYKNRVEENDLFAVSLRNLGHTAVEFHEMGGLDHGGVRRGSWLIIPGFIKRTLAPASTTP